MFLAYSIADQSFQRSASLGILNVSMALLGELAHRPEFQKILVYRDPSIEIDPEVLRRPSIVTRDVQIRRAARRVAWEQWGVNAEAKRDGADWLLLPKGFSSFLRPPAIRTVAYVHDIMAATYFDMYPAHGGRLKQAYFSRCLAATLRTATAIVTNTEFTRGEILGWARRQGIAPRADVIVAGYGLPEAQPPPDHREELIVSDIRDVPHKRSDLAVRYLAKWCRDTGFGGKIVFAGRPPNPLPSQTPPSWVFAGRVSPSRYGELMRSALAHVHFTEYEGFGLPPAEAIMWGTPAVYSEVGATAEAMGGVGCPFQNSAYPAFAGAMDRALRADAATIAGWQRSLGARHNWKGVGERVIAALMGGC